MVSEEERPVDVRSIHAATLASWDRLRKSPLTSPVSFAMVAPMTKTFCDKCGNELEPSAHPFFESESAELSKSFVSVTVRSSDEETFCRGCVLDAVAKMDKRPTPSVATGTAAIDNA